MKIILLNPKYWVPDWLIHIPLELWYISSILKKEWHNVKVIDMVFWDISLEELNKEVKINNPDLLVAHTITKSYANLIKEIKSTKKNYPNLKIVVFWEHVTFIAEEVLSRIKEIDIVAKYEADYTIKEIANNKNLNEIKWIVYRNNNWKIITNNNKTPIINLDEIPFPDRKAFPIKKYLNHDFETIIQTTRWCYMKCKFCLRTKYWRILRARKLENIIKEIKETLDLWFQRIFFYDDTFTYSKKRILYYCKLIKESKLNFNWACNMRIDNVLSSNYETTYDLLKKMKESWCYRVFIWLESSDDKVLKNVDKWITSNDVLEAFKRIKEHWIEIHWSFALWMIWDTEESINKTVEFARKIRPDMISFNLMTPYPWTEICEDNDKYWITIPNKYWYEKTDWYKQPIAWVWNISAEKLLELTKQAYINYLS